MTKHVVSPFVPHHVDDERFNGNGAVPNAALMRRLANGFNAVATRCKKQILMRCQLIQDVDPSSGALITVWPFAFRTGEYTTGITVLVGQALATTGGAGSAQIEIRTMDAGVMVIDEDLDYAGQSASGTVDPQDIHHATYHFTGFLANTEYHGKFLQFGGARIVYASIVENMAALAASVLADDTVAGACNPGAFVAEGPIYDAQIADLKDANNGLWRRNGAHLVQWSKDALGDSPSITATAYTNVEDGSTAVAATTVGVNLHTQYHNTVNRTTVPVRLAVDAFQTVGSGNVLSVRLTDGTNVIEFPSFTNASFGPNGNWAVVSGTIPAQAGTKWDIQAKVNGGTFVLYAVALWEYEDDDGREFPGTSAEWASAFPGIAVPTSLWPCQDTVLPMVDTIAAKNLSSFNTSGNELVQQTGDPYGRKSILLEHIASHLRSNTTDFDLNSSTSFSAFMRFRFSTTSGAGQHLMRKKSGTSGLDGWAIQVNGSGHMSIIIDTPGAAVASATVAVNHNDGSFHDILAVIDRTASMIHIYTDLGSASASIAGHTTMTNGQIFGFGDTQGTLNACARGDYSYAAAWLATALTAADFDTLRGL